MCEILMIVGLCSSLGKKLREKGRTPIGYQLLAAAAWVGAELVGVFIAAIVMAGAGGDPGEGGIFVFAIVGILCGAAGGGLVYAIASSLPPVAGPYGQNPYGSPPVGPPPGYNVGQPPYGQQPYGQQPQYPPVAPPPNPDAPSPPYNPYSDPGKKY